MEGLIKTTEKKEDEEEFSFKNYFVPLTNAKAITWIVIIGLIVYFNSLFNGFVGDDLGQIVTNQAITSLSNIPNFFFGGTFYNGSLTSLSGGYYRPIVSLTYALLYSFLNGNPFPFHLFQLVIHILNTIFVFLIFRFFLKKNISFLLALLFLLHPIQSEAVDYIADLEDIMFFFFGS